MKNKIKHRRQIRSHYSHWFYVPAAIVYTVLFLMPTLSSFYFSLTRWDLFKAKFIGLDNFKQFFLEPFLFKGLLNTFIYACLTSGLKVVFGLLLAVLLTSNIFGRSYLRSVIFFPTLVSTVGIGITFTVMMHPTEGVINNTLSMLGITGPNWLTSPSLALFSVAIVDIWKGVGLATLIFIAGIVSIPSEYYEASKMDGASSFQQFIAITLPLVKPATITVITLSFIGGLRTFDLIWTMTKGGPGFSSDVLASVIYKQYQAGFYGLSTAGNVVLFAIITLLIVPFTLLFNKKDET